MEEFIVSELKPPYVLVAFSSVRTDVEDGYTELNDHLMEKAKTVDGFLGLESIRHPDGRGITNLFWRDMDAVNQWKRDTEHMEAKKLGRKQWYKSYRLRISVVETEYGFKKDQ